MHIIETSAYRKAFIQYLRKGTAIDISLKAAANEHATTHYIWRTQGDDKVRASHAANNGKIFAWDNPPETGHPGEDYNCRCTAEPYVQGSTEFAYQTLVSSINDVSPKWTNVDLTQHFYLGGGRGVTLSEIGHLHGVINYYFYSLGKYSDVNAQIVDAARKHLGSEFAYPFDNSYGFRGYLYVFGGGVIAGMFVGSSRYQNGMLVVKGKVEFFYDDTFTDPVDLREGFRENSNPGNATALQIALSDLGGITAGMAAYNYGSGASIGLFYMLHGAEAILRPGDVALLALEYQNYGDADVTAEAVKSLFIQRYPYRFAGGFIEYLRLLAMLDAAFVTDVLLTAASGASPEETTRGRLSPFGAYPKHPAASVTEALPAKVEREPLVTPERMRLTPFARQQLTDFISRCQTKCVTVLAT